MYNEVSLSPWTDLTDKALALVVGLEERPVVNFFGWLLRRLCRHLTAFDLVTFHHRGANYPDALLLDALLKAYLDQIERHPELFEVLAADHPDAGARRLRRRALRQGWLLRRHYEGHPVPEQPTSPGENSRVLPDNAPRVPEEQILQAARRPRQLYSGDALAALSPRVAQVLQASVVDLEHPAELRELGTALYLDRPLGAGKAPGEPDATPLLSSVAFSPTVALGRLPELARLLSWPADHPILAAAQQALRDRAFVAGVPLDAVGGASRPGGVSLRDALLAAPDFVFLHTTPATVEALLGLFDLAGLMPTGPVLIALDRTGQRLLVRDRQGRIRIEAEVDRSAGFAVRAGVEYPRAGLRVLQVDDRPVSLVLEPR
jgi:hypothetical protein